MKRTMPIGLNSSTDPRVAKRLNRKMIIGIVAGVLSAYVLLLVSGLAIQTYQEKKCFDITVENGITIIKSKCGYIHPSVPESLRK